MTLIELRDLDAYIAMKMGWEGHYITPLLPGFIMRYHPGDAVPPCVPPYSTDSRLSDYILNKYKAVGFVLAYHPVTEEWVCQISSGPFCDSPLKAVAISRALQAFLLGPIDYMEEVNNLPEEW